MKDYQPKYCLLHKFVKVEMVPRLELVYVDIKIGNTVVKKKDLEYRLRCPRCEEELKNDKNK